MPVPGQYDLLVEVKAVSVNPVDTKVHAGLQKSGLQQPRILGWDASGIVVGVGSGVSGFKPGDEVWYAGDITRPGSNSSHQLIDSRIAAHKPCSLNWAESAALPLTALTAREALFRTSKHSGCAGAQDAVDHRRRRRSRLAGHSAGRIAQQGESDRHRLKAGIRRTVP